MNDEIKFWFTTKTGKHIPVKEGETKEQALKKAFGNKSENNKKWAADKRKTESNNRERYINAQKREADRLNKEDNRTVNSGVVLKNGKIKIDGKDVPELDTSSVNFAYPKNAHDRDSFDDNVIRGNDGKMVLSPERQKLHAKIMQKYMEGHEKYGPNDEKLALFTGGGGASGKGNFSKNIDKFYSKNDNPIIIDPDEFKKDLARADGKELDDKLTGYYHEESSALAKQFYESLLMNNYPVMFDGTATGVGSTMKKLAQAEKYGYKTEMSFIYSDWPTVRQNSLDRYEKHGRLVPWWRLVGAHKKAYSAVTALYNKFDSFKLYDNAGRNFRQVGYSKKGGRLLISDKASWRRFSESENEFDISKYEIARYIAACDAITAKRAKNKIK